MTYKLLTYRYRSHAEPRCGILVGDTVHDTAEILDEVSYVSVRSVLDDWSAASGRLAKAATGKLGTGMRLADVRLEAPVLYPGAIYCAGANYRDHVDNMARKLNIPPEPDPHELGLNPWHFIKSSWCAVGDGADVALASDFLDWEAELAVVIGRTARNVPLDKVFDHVAGYTAANDLSARDRTQREAVPIASPFRYDWIGQKNFDGACPIGPWIVPADQIPDPQSLAIRTYVNDALKQNSTTAKMLFSIAEQVAHLSSRITLHPGDVILTGTPAGVGAETGDRLARGDRVRVEIEKIGTLVTNIA
jgi:2-keto-4-pentenoate hydratase/2-oxohepta-3-ene-1,7-dioic acid hydratase in catechol pathway